MLKVNNECTTCVYTGIELHKIESVIVRFQVLTAASMKFRVFWDILPHSQIDVDQRFRGACCLHHQGDDGGSTHL
jgi:hypothetical protein